jgi:hypothetical protein
MGTFYEEIAATIAQNDEALKRYEETCAGYANRIRRGLHSKLDWPDEQLALVDFDEPPAGSRRASTFGHVSRDGFHFGVKVSGADDWHIVFYWTMHVLPLEKVELAGDPDNPLQTIVLDLRPHDPDEIEPLAAYLREKIRAFVQRFTLASLTRKEH